MTEVLDYEVVAMELGSLHFRSLRKCGRWLLASMESGCFHEFGFLFSIVHFPHFNEVWEMPDEKWEGAFFSYGDDH